MPITRVWQTWIWWMWKRDCCEGVNRRKQFVRFGSIRFNKITVWPLTWHWLRSWECTNSSQTKINDFANEHTNCCSRFRICQCNGFASTLHYTKRYGSQLMASSQTTDEWRDGKRMEKAAPSKVILHKITNLTARRPKWRQWTCRENITSQASHENCRDFREF